MRLSPHLRPRVLVLLLAAALPACSVFEQPQQQRGVHVDADQLKELVPGTTTRADVTSVIGSPTAHATFDDNTWIYIGEITRPRIARVQGVETQNVLVLTFDQGGVLRTVNQLNGHDSQPVEVVDRTTPSPGSSSSFMQQLLGNVGRYSPAAGLTTGGSSGGPPTGGAPTR